MLTTACESLVKETSIVKKNGTCVIKYLKVYKVLFPIQNFTFLFLTPRDTN